MHLRIASPEMLGLPLSLAVPFGVLTVSMVFLVFLGVFKWWMKRGGRGAAGIGLMRLLLVYALVLVAGLAQAEPPASSFDGVILATHSALGRVPVKSWKQLRDDRVVKQDLDYSCGAASLATLLNEYYGQRLSEE